MRKYFVLTLALAAVVSLCVQAGSYYCGVSINCGPCNGGIITTTCNLRGFTPYESYSCLYEVKEKSVTCRAIAEGGYELGQTTSHCPECLQSSDCEWWEPCNNY